MTDIRISHRCCWRFRAYWILHCFDWETITGVSKDRSASERLATF